MNDSGSKNDVNEVTGPQQPAVESTIDDELGVILEQYLQQQEQGEAVPREQFLAMHPKFADRLAACLDGAALFGARDLRERRESPKDERPIAP